MRKIFVTTVVCLSSVLVSKAQSNATAHYTNHKVVAGETLYGLARKYNVDPKTFAALNNLPVDKGLIIGQTVKVPASGGAVDETPKESSAAKGSQKHTVAKSETLFRIANTYNVSVDDIKKWNNLTSDNIAAGTTLIVSAPSAKSNRTQKATAANNMLADAKTNEAIKEASAVETPTEKIPLNADKKTEEKAEAPTQQVTQAPVVKSEPPVNNQSSAVFSQPSTPSTEVKNDDRKIDMLSSSAPLSNTGVFEALYPTDAQKTPINITGEAATFKTTSGWQDKKYYVLINDVAPGTILKIAANDNKYVFAKVLGAMPEMKENKGLLLRMSNAAASYLGIIDPKFPVQVSFYQ